MADVDWKSMKDKSIKSPFIPLVINKLFRLFKRIMMITRNKFLKIQQIKMLKKLESC